MLKTALIDKNKILCYNRAKQDTSAKGEVFMQIITKNTNDLKPYERNTKKHDSTQIANVAQSISNYGFVQPIVIDGNNIVVIGHCRLLAAQKLGLDTVPCVMVDTLTEEQVKALRIVDNKTNESPWDMDFLAQELADIDIGEFAFDFNIKSDNGFTDEELESLMADEVEARAPKEIHRVTVECKSEQETKDVAELLEANGYKPTGQNS